MDVVADVLLAAGAFGAAAYCFLLQLRLKAFQALESGMGSAIAVLSAQVDEMTRALDAARAAAGGQSAALADLTARGEAAAARIELLLAAMHDLPQPQAAAGGAPGAERRLRVVRGRAPRAGLEAAE
jgi:hypothetical protein